MQLTTAQFGRNGIASLDRLVFSVRPIGRDVPVAELISEAGREMRGEADGGKRVEEGFSSLSRLIAGDVSGAKPQLG